MSTELSSTVVSQSYTYQQITNCLFTKRDQFSIIPNDRFDTKANYWKIMGYPAKLNCSNKMEKIDGFISCQKCFKTYVYNRRTGTTHLNNHKCIKMTKSSISLEGSILKQSSIVTTWSPADLKSFKLTDKEMNKVKNLCSRWLCENVRPFSIIQDNGLRNFIQE